MREIGQSSRERKSSEANARSGPVGRGHWLSKVIRFVVGVSILVAVFRSIDLENVVVNLTFISPVLAIALCITASLHRVLMAFKWNLLLGARGISIPHWQSIRLYFVGSLAGSLTPGAIGADVYRVAALSSLRRNQVVVSTVLLERLIGIVAISVFAVLGLPVSLRYLGSSSKSLGWAMAIGATFAVAGLLVSLSPATLQFMVNRFQAFMRFRIVRRCRECFETYVENRKHPRTLFAFMLLTGVEIFTLVSVNYLAARALDIDISFGYFLCVIPLVHILIRLPISVWGIGVQEGLFAYFVMKAGFPPANGISISLLLRLVSAVSVFAPAVVMLWVCPVRLCHLPESGGELSDPAHFPQET